MAALSSAFWGLMSPDSFLSRRMVEAYSPVRNAIVNSSSYSTLFFAGVEEVSEKVLTFYNPTLPSADRQNAGLPFMTGTDVFLAVSSYLLFVLVASKLGPKACAQKPQVSTARPVKTVREKLGPIFVLQLIYNLVQVFLCGITVYQVLYVHFSEGYTFLCNNFNVTGSRMSTVTWFFYLLKYLDLLDTVFMIIRGNWRQVSFLHVFHHSSVIYVMWVNASVGYDGEMYYVTLLNGFVHVVMYFYYFMASLNMRLARVIKKLVTKLQMAQFAAMIGHGLFHLYAHKECPYPVRNTAGYFVYVILLYALFHQFSRVEYSDQKGKKA